MTPKIEGCGESTRGIVMYPICLRLAGMRKRTGSLALVLLVLCLGLSGRLWAAQDIEIIGEGRYRVTSLTDQDPVLTEIFKTANDIGFRVGTWGGASRDFLLGRGVPPEFSDVDMVYDSSEFWHAMTKDGPLGFVKNATRLAKGFVRVAKVGGLKALRRYTYLDIKEGGKPLTTGLVKMINSGGASLNQVGLMSDGSILDPTGGFSDIQNNVLRYRVPKPIATMVADLDDIHNPSPYDVLRMVRFKVQYPELEWAPGTYERLKEIMRLYAADSEYTAEVARYAQGFRGKLHRAIPKGLRHPVASAETLVFGADRSNLWPFIEKGLKKIKESSPDPAESLRILEDLGFREFSAAIGLGPEFQAIEEKAAHAPGPSELPPAASQGTEPELDPVVEAVEGAQVRARIRSQSYRAFVEAQQAGNMLEARKHLEILRLVGGSMSSESEGLEP